MLAYIDARQVICFNIHLFLSFLEAFFWWRGDTKALLEEFVSVTKFLEKYIEKKEVAAVLGKQYNCFLELIRIHRRFQELNENYWR